MELIGVDGEGNQGNNLADGITPDGDVDEDK